MLGYTNFLILTHTTPHCHNLITASKAIHATIIICQNAYTHYPLTRSLVETAQSQLEVGINIPDQ